MVISGVWFLELGSFFSYFSSKFNGEEAVVLLSFLVVVFNSPITQT